MTEERFESLADRWMRAHGEWRRDRLPYRSRRTSLVARAADWVLIGPTFKGAVVGFQVGDRK